MKDKLKIIYNKLKNILSNQKTLLGVVIFICIMIVTIIISINILNKGTVSTLRNHTWEDFVIYIAGNTIELGTKMNTLKEKGLILRDTTYEERIMPVNYVTSGILYTYKEEANPNNTIYLSAYNTKEKTITFEESQLKSIEINKNFYKNNSVVLPKGLVLDENLKIDNIIQRWTTPTFHENNVYKWENNIGEITFYTNSNNTIFSVIYNKK